MSRFAKGVGKGNGMVCFVLGGRGATCGVVDQGFSLLGGNTFSAPGRGVPFVSANRRLALQKSALMMMSAERVDRVKPPMRSIKRRRG